VLFVFTLGLQLGPGFFAALRQSGLKLNLLAAITVSSGAVCAPLLGWLAGFDPAAVLGVFAGASINIPALGAASGRQVWHMPVNTSLAFREFGIALFFAAVGLQAGGKFFATAFSPLGLHWLLAGLCVTMLPLLLVGLFARGVWRMNVMDLSGLLAGSMTNPPGLSFATNLAHSDAPNVAYATVYPLTTLPRILCAQVLAIVLFR
jgi:putative transport protein